MRKEVYIVYKTTGPNNLYYIGVHKTFTENNILFEDGYIGCGIDSEINNTSSRTLSRFGIAVYLTGYKNWKRETIEIFSTEIEAYLRESELVTTELFTSDFNCLNSIKGGKRNINISQQKLYKLSIYDINGNIVKSYNNIIEACLELKLHRQAFTIASELKRTLTKNNYRFKFFDTIPEISIEPLKKLNKMKPVALYNIIDGQLLGKGFTMREISNEFNLDERTLHRCCKGEYKSIERKYKAIFVDDINDVPLIIELPVDYLVNKPCGGSTHKKYKSKQINSNK